VNNIPEKRLSSIGRYPSDIDGDCDRTSCADCGINRCTHEMDLRVNNYGNGPVYYHVCDDCNRWSRERDGLDE